MIRFAMLGSGSKGNGSVVECGRTRVLVDCGFPVAETERRLARLNLVPQDVSAILVTHEHSDHIGGVAAFARRNKVPVWLTTGTRKGWTDPVDPRLISPHERFAIGDLEIEPYPVPHDAREPSQFVFSDGARRLGLLSDIGSVTPHVVATLSGCDALMIEFNHDADMLESGPYPRQLKKRVAGTRGHLSNAQAATLLSALDCSRLRHLVLIHLSETNNTPELARTAAADALGCTPDWMVCAEQEQGLGWRELA